MKNLDVIEREAAEGQLVGACTGYPEQIADILSEEKGDSRQFTMEEVQRIVAEKVAQERVRLECREYLLSHFYNLDHVSEELDRVMRILEPKSVDELADKLTECEALDGAGGVVTRSASASPRSLTASLRQIFTRK